jgi:hypothetical protein
MRSLWNQLGYSSARVPVNMYMPVCVSLSLHGKGSGHPARASKFQHKYLASEVGIEARKVCTPHLVPPKKFYVSRCHNGLELPSCVALFLSIY